MSGMQDFFSVRAKSLNDAIECAWKHSRDCQYEYGHSGFTGTFAELEMITDLRKQVETMDEAYALAEVWMETSSTNTACVIRAGDVYLFAGWFRD